MAAKFVIADVSLMTITIAPTPVNFSNPIPNLQRHRNTALFFAVSEVGETH